MGVMVSAFVSAKPTGRVPDRKVCIYGFPLRKGAEYMHAYATAMACNDESVL